MSVSYVIFALLIVHFCGCSNLVLSSFIMKFSRSLVLAAGAASLATATATEQQQPLKKHDRRPNIVVVLTDDQDLHMDSVDYMPLLKKNVIDHGTFYKRHFCSTAICCPSRATLWTGRNAHNTNVTDVFPPYGNEFSPCRKLLC